MSDHFDLDGTMPGRLDALLAAPDGRDWLDVTRRARRGARPARRSARVLAVALVLLVVGTPLALAFGARVLDAITGDDVPADVRQFFSRLDGPDFPTDGAPPGSRLPARIAGSERRVLSIRTESGATASLYVVRTEDGGMCHVASGGPFNGGGCTLGKNVGRGDFDAGTVGTGRQDPSEKDRVAHGITLSGHTTKADATTIRVRYPDGSSDIAKVVEGWYLFEVPTAHELKATAPVALEVLGADGDVLARQDDPLLLQQPKAERTEPLPETIRVAATAELPNDGGTVTVSTARDRNGDRCFSKLRDGKAPVGLEWQCGPKVAHEVTVLMPDGAQKLPVWWQAGVYAEQGRPGYVYAYGWVAPRVASLEVRFQDGSTERLALRNRTFLYVVPPDRFVDGRRPSVVMARDVAGEELWRGFLHPRARCSYPVEDAACADHIVRTG